MPGTEGARWKRIGHGRRKTISLRIGVARGGGGEGAGRSNPTLPPCGQLTRCFSAVAELLVILLLYTCLKEKIKVGVHMHKSQRIWIGIVTQDKASRLLCPSLGAFLAFLNDVALDWFAAVFRWRFPGKCDGIFGCSFTLWLTRFARRICTKNNSLSYVI